MGVDFFVGIIVGIFIACFFVLAIGSALRMLSRPADTSQPANDLPPVPAEYELLEANQDAARLAGALEAGLVNGWPFNARIIYALARHHERTGPREIEPAPRLN
jgi:MFS superfamily sulfate permease-like transporter